jgi:hypothetical protein
MKAYVIAAETIKDQAMFDDYRKLVPETVAPFGGRFVARGGNLSVLEGEWPHSRLVIIESRRGPTPRPGTGRRRIRRSSRSGTRAPSAISSSSTERLESLCPRV